MATQRRTPPPPVDAFKRDLAQVCRAHGLVLSHEDTQGAFLVVPLTEAGLAWVLEAEYESGE